MSAPVRAAPVAADRLRRLARRLALVAVAVGGGFLLALLFQGPASADGTRGGSGDELHRQLGALVEPVQRVTVTERPDHDPLRGVRADDARASASADARRHGGRHAPLTGAIAGVVGARDVPSPPALRRPTDATRTSVPPSRAGTPVRPEAARHERLRPSTASSAIRHPAHRARSPRSAAASARQPATAAPDHRELPEALGPPAVAGLLTPVLRPAVDVVRALPIVPVVAALLHVVDAVLPPALGAVVVPTPRSPLAPPAREPTAVSPGATPAPTPPDPALPAPAAATPPPAAPPPTTVAAHRPPPAPPGHPAARPAPPAVADYPPGRPVTPVDQDAAGTDEGSPPAPGLVRPAHRQSHPGIAALCHLVPLFVASRTPSAIARPG
ncbi:hypothetical protein [Micromonospora sp. WMMD736]|uniref:hypothetical protein n=1 Tax=Micromonospora sp. WMMD736 TaxID=3404112 RepID=UPI003B958969